MKISNSTDQVWSNTTMSLPPPVFESYGLRCFRLTFYGFIVLASILGNGIVIKSIFTIPYRKPLTYHMVSSLAIAEVIGSLVVPFIQTYDEMYTWPFGELMCHLVSPAQISSGLVVTWTLAIISVHRYRTIVQQSRPIYIKNSSFFIVFMWICAIIVTFPSFLYSKLVKSPYDNRSNWCVVLFPGDTLADFPSPVYKRYLLVRFIINFIAPMMIMFLSYGAIGIKLRYHMLTIRNTDISTSEISAAQIIGGTASGESSITKHENNTAMTSFKPDESPRSLRFPEAESPPAERNSIHNIPQQQNPVHLLVELEQDLLKMIYMIVIVFILLYIPYQVYFFLEYFEVVDFDKWQYHHVTRKYIFLMTCLPSALHPICYGTMSRFYAKVFRGVVLCRGTNQFNN